MKSLRLLMVFSDNAPTKSPLLASLLSELGLEVKLVHSLQEGLLHYRSFDAVLMDIDFSAYYSASILEKGEIFEWFLNAPYPVFNALRKMQDKRVLLYSTMFSSVVEDKLKHMKLNHVEYYLAPLTPQELVEAIHTFHGTYQGTSV